MHDYNRGGEDLYFCHNAKKENGLKETKKSVYRTQERDGLIFCFIQMYHVRFFSLIQFSLLMYAIKCTSVFECSAQYDSHAWAVSQKERLNLPLAFSLPISLPANVALPYFLQMLHFSLPKSQNERFLTTRRKIISRKIYAFFNPSLTVMG